MTAARVLICGGREYDDARAMANAFDYLRERFPSYNPIIIHGGARGADTLAHIEARRRGWATAEMAANWQVHGKAAGPIRNGWMLNLRPDLVLAFPGGNGTADMVRQAQRRGVQVIQMPPRTPPASNPTPDGHPEEA